MFNRVETFYCFDEATHISVIAAQCGCESIILPTPGLTRGSWEGHISEGIAYGLDDRERAKETLPLLVPKLLSIETDGIEQTRTFVADMTAVVNKHKEEPMQAETNGHPAAARPELKTYARKLAICTPLPLDHNKHGNCLPLIRADWHRARMQIVPPMGYNCLQIHVDGFPIDKARNKAVELAKREQCKYLFFLDWDVIPGPLALTRLVYVAENYPEYDLISGLYTSRSNPSEPLIWREWDEGVFYDWTFGESVQCVGVPAGCLLIRMSVFDKLDPSKPYFVSPESIKREEVDGRQYVCRSAGTEDLYFCKRLETEVGPNRILCDTRVICGHQDRDTGEIFMLGADTLPMRRWKEATDRKAAEEESQPEGEFSVVASE